MEINEAFLREKAKTIRCDIIEMLAAAGSGHAAGALGLADIVSAIYFGLLSKTARPSNSHLIVSNGHVCPVLYAAMVESGQLDRSDLLTLRKFGSKLQGHPERTILPEVITTSGPLGEGLSQAAGMAYAYKYLLNDRESRIYCIVGDGELNEGQCWEAIMFAAKYELSNLYMIIDKNNIQLSGNTADIMPMDDMYQKMVAFRWYTHVLNSTESHNPMTVYSTLRQLGDRVNDGEIKLPIALIAETIPGKGVSFMENDYHWHGKAPTAEQAAKALAELREEK